MNIDDLIAAVRETLTTPGLSERTRENVEAHARPLVDHVDGRVQLTLDEFTGHAEALLEFADADVQAILDRVGTQVDDLASTTRARELRDAWQGGRGSGQA